MPSDETFEVDSEFLFVGRTFEEYCRMFGLEPATLAGRTVLDCPGGPSSFAAVAAEVAERAVAVDPMYGPPAERLRDVCLDAVERNVTQLREKRDMFVWDEYGDVATRGRYLRAAAERFLADYAHHPGRYLQAGLPDLPLATDAVGLALSGNLLFLYDDRLAERFHVDALLELARVAREVRVFTLHSLDRQRSPYVESVLTAAREAGLDARTEPVDYEFQPGATEALVLPDTAGFAGG